MKLRKKRMNANVVKERKTKKKLWKVICIGSIVIFLIGGTIVVMNQKSKASQEGIETVSKETKAVKGNLTTGITESGSTVAGTVTLDYDITATLGSTNNSSIATSSSSQNTGDNPMGETSNTSNSTNSSSTTNSDNVALEVEEIYVGESDTVEEGADILKVTDESYQNVKQQLQQALDTAKLQLEQAKIDRDLEKTSANSSYAKNNEKEEIANETYNNTLKKLSNAVTSAQKSISDTKKSITEYQKAISDDTYYSENNVPTLKKLVITKKAEVKLWKKKVSNLGKAQGGTMSKEASKDVSNIGNTSNNSSSTTVTPTTTPITSASTPLEEAKNQLTIIEKELEEAKDNYAKAVDKTKSQITETKNQIKKLSNELTNLQLQYNEAITAKKQGILDAKATLEEELVSAKNASTLYDIQLDGIDDDVESAEETLQNAKEQLEKFNQLVVDGKVKSNCAGMVTSIGYEVGDEISSATSIATFANSSKMTVTVSVDQEDIASISLNDQVNVSFTAYGEKTYTGTVTNISTTASSENSSTVNYPVTVTLSGDVSGIYAGMTANVTFITKEIKEVLYVSNKAIIKEGTISYVKRKEADGTIEKIKVVTGFSDGNNVQITDGIEEGDVVLIESQVNKSASK